MYQIKVTIQSAAPIMMNRFTDEAAAKISAGSSSAITVSNKGTPREQATPKLYLSSDKKPMIPGPNIFAALVAAGVFHKAGRKQITTGKSSLIPAGIMVDEMECPLFHPFDKDVKDLQWEVDSRSVVIPSTGGRVMCHRPRFDVWALKFTLNVDEKMFDEAIVRLLVDDMGSKIGLGDFRPARKGPFGRFNVAHWEVQKTKVGDDKKSTKAA